MNIYRIGMSVVYLIIMSIAFAYGDKVDAYTALICMTIWGASVGRE